MPRRRRLSRDEVEEQYGTTGGFMIPLRLSRRGGLVWALLLAIVALLALAGGLPGGTGSVELDKVLQPFSAAETVPGPAPRAPRTIAEDVQEMWRVFFQEAGERFEPARIVVFDESATTDCGEHRAATLPDTFYCHADKRFLVDGRVTSAYTVVHGYSHHVQEILDITDQIARGAGASPKQAPDLWRRHELQADCLAGVWAHRFAGPGRTQDHPDTPDHFIEERNWRDAPRAQRDRWFRRGFEHGDPSACDTFTRDA